jgi:Lateral organ boundaries (LOB) domain
VCEHISPLVKHAAIFKSLLYEACGRIVNPVYGSVGLLWSGKWQLCQAAVESVLKGAPITQLATTSAPTSVSVVAPIQASDIRHLANRKNHGAIDLHKVNARSRAQFKQPGFWSIRAETGEPGPLEGEILLEQSAEIAKGFSTGPVEHVVIKREQDTATRDLGLDLTLGPKCKSGDEEGFSSDESSQEICRVELSLTVRG